MVAEWLLFPDSLTLRVATATLQREVRTIVGKALGEASGAAGGFTVPMEHVPEIAEKWYWPGGNPKTRIINRNLERHIMEDYSVDEQQAKALHDAARDYAEQLPTSSEGFYTDEPGQVFQNGSDIRDIGD